MVSPVGGPRAHPAVLADAARPAAAPRDRVEGYRRVGEAEATERSRQPRDVRASEDRYQPSAAARADREAALAAAAGPGAAAEQEEATDRYPPSAAARADREAALAAAAGPGAAAEQEEATAREARGLPVEGAAPAEGAEAEEVVGVDGADEQDGEEVAGAAEDETDDDGASASTASGELKRMQARDQEVRRHEMAHAAAGGAYAGQPRYELERGPDGTLYATGGQVRIDVSPVPGDAEATVRKMRQVRRAALAPAQPSAQDRQVASRASAEESKARQVLREADAPMPVEEDAEATSELETEHSPDADAAKSARTVMTLHAQRAYARRSEPPPSA